MIGLFNIPPGSPLIFEVQPPHSRFAWDNLASARNIAGISEFFERRSLSSRPERVQFLKDGRKVHGDKVSQCHSPSQCWEQAMARSRLLINTGKVLSTDERTRNECLGQSSASIEPLKEDRPKKVARPMAVASTADSNHETKRQIEVAHPIMSEENGRSEG